MENFFLPLFLTYSFYIIIIIIFVNLLSRSTRARGKSTVKNRNVAAVTRCTSYDCPRRRDKVERTIFFRLIIHR